MSGNSNLEFFAAKLTTAAPVALAAPKPDAPCSFTAVPRRCRPNELVNQQTYHPRDHPYGGEVESTYGRGVIVHPGGRRGALDVELEGCYTFNGLHASECTGWQTLTFEL